MTKIATQELIKKLSGRLITQNGAKGWFVGITPAGNEWIAWLKEGETFQSESFLCRFANMVRRLERIDQRDPSPLTFANPYSI